MQHICRNKGLTSLDSTEKHDDVAVTCFLIGLVILFFVYHTAQLRNRSLLNSPQQVPATGCGKLLLRNSSPFTQLKRQHTLQECTLDDRARPRQLK